MPLLNANIKLSSHVELLKLHNSYFITWIGICISFLSETWKHYAKLNCFILLLDQAHCAITLYLTEE